MVDYNGRIYTYVHNLQGDIVALLDTVGNKVVEYNYDAWGMVLGTLTTGIGVLNPFRYRGYIYDKETRGYYLQNRYYSTLLNRFLTPDIVLGSIGEENDNNVFSYCRNNPLIRKDSDGNWWQFIGAAIGAVVSSALEIASQVCDGASIDDINWKKVGVAAVSGAVSGFVASTGIGLAGQIGINAALGAASYAADESLNGGTITLEGLAINTVAGGLSGAIGGKGADLKGAEAVWNSTNKHIQRELRRRNTEYAAKRIIMYQTTKRSIIRSVTFSAVRYTAGGLASKRGTRWMQNYVY